jgi:hypothetical protein
LWFNALMDVVGRLKNIMKQSKVTTIIGWVAAVLLALLMIASAFAKLTATADGEMAKGFQALGIWPMIVPLGILELSIAVLMLIPRTSTGALLLAIGYWGGALATDLSHGGAPVPAIVALVLLTVIAIFRNNEVLARFLGKPLPGAASA